MKKGEDSYSRLVYAGVPVAALREIPDPKHYKYHKIAVSKILKNLHLKRISVTDSCYWFTWRIYKTGWSLELIQRIIGNLFRKYKRMGNKTVLQQEPFQYCKIGEFFYVYGRVRFVA